jgi:hypothetical protein
MSDGVLVSGMITLSRPLSCKECGAIFMSRHTLHLGPVSVTFLPQIAKNQMPNIPVGWSMSGRDNITCIDCIMERDTPL